MQQIAVVRNDIADVRISESTGRDLEDGEVRLAVERFGLSSNNVSYALFGEMLGYWGHFPVDDTLGCIPVWGFAGVTETRHPDVAVGERVFGYLPMASESIVRPTAVDELAFSDAIDHRSGLHPWYRRIYRCDADPAWSADREGLQATMWALFMTGWALADDIAEAATSVVVASASSKTALSLAWSLRHHDADVAVVGITSASNVGFVESSSVYDVVTTYDELDLDAVTGPVALVDAAGSPGIKERIHAALGDRLADSVALGATHQGAGAAAGDLVGPAPRFFFIPDVAEAESADGGHAEFHGRFADAWHRFAPWIDERLDLSTASGADEIVATYREVLAGRPGPHEGTVLSW